MVRLEGLGKLGEKKNAMTSSGLKPSTFLYIDGSLFNLYLCYIRYGILSARYWDGAAGWTTGFRFPAGSRNMSLLHSIQTGSVARPDPSLGTRAAGAWS
jgi:hypothetical protein